jgi:hypothetical protein
MGKLRALSRIIAKNCRKLAMTPPRQSGRKVETRQTPNRQDHADKGDKDGGREIDPNRYGRQEQKYFHLRGK